MLRSCITSINPFIHWELSQYLQFFKAIGVSLAWYNVLPAAIHNKRKSVRWRIASVRKSSTTVGYTQTSKG
jgi:hypothetical protein